MKLSRNDGMYVTTSIQHTNDIQEGYEIWVQFFNDGEILGFDRYEVRSTKW